MLYYFVQKSGAWLDSHSLFWAFRVLYEVQFRALAAALIAFAIVLLFGRRTIRFLTRMKIGDSGLTDAEALRGNAKSKANTPTMGGALIAGAIAVSTLLMADLGNFYVYTGLVVLAWLAILGGFDDWLKLTSVRRGSASRQGLYAWEKLVFQLGLGFLVGLFAYQHGDQAGSGDLFRVLNIPFQKTYSDASGTLNTALVILPKGAYILLAVLMIAGLSNAVNITDGMDGLATGISTAVTLGLCVLVLVAGTVGAAQYLYVPYVKGTAELGVMAGAMAGACLGFLWWNCSPAQVFMGDTGSLCLGGLIGYIALAVRQEALVLLMCGAFLMEIASVMLQVGYFKASGGKRIFRCAPFHHHLHLGGWTEQQVVARAWIVSILLVVVALATVKLR
jgi:phospho-N-acetylmuramoyl-pentapeptide-transferase